ncbi:N-acetylmuramic acid 6-phosphate etherase [Prochlorococcus marinus]|uniref:N-acetylmuramic acid 6-phosphate etherase n=1 Tax=Prochlorococcus marinus TaxID=1219 RepID=UPI0022B30CD7|nr:N-acetylmuramic acid 6-phosphate etherase [Prochlorococcus marinus]
MINFNINLNRNKYRILTEQINTTSNELDIKSTYEIVNIFSEADKEPQKAVEKAIPEIVNAIDEITTRLKSNGRLFYIGTGTSGRLGVLDASECPPTFCTNPDLVQGIIAGGVTSLTRSSESLEDLPEIAIDDLKNKNFSNRDVLIGITSSGNTPYVLGALNYSKSINALTISISSVPECDSTLDNHIDIRLITGPEILAGSTRLKAGTATKMALNIISTSVMIKLGKVYGNRMIDLSVSNDKLMDRAIGILSDLGSVDKETAVQLLKNTNGSVKLSLLMALSGMDVFKAKQLLNNSKGNLRTALNKVKDC